jgi:hypothetical protein
MEKNNFSINFLQIGIGFAALAVGTLVYIIDRPPGDTYFISHFGIEALLPDRLPTLFGRAGNVLPALTHAFALPLITAGILSSGKKGCGIIVVCWFLVDLAFEIGQQFGSSIAERVPVWFRGIPFLENTGAFFRRGTFDWLDVLAIALGAASAYAIALPTCRRNRP